MTVTLSEVVGPDRMLVDVTGWRCINCGAYWEAHQQPSEGPQCCPTPFRVKVSLVKPIPSWRRDRA